jgi:hypothetical protein
MRAKIFDNLAYVDSMANRSKCAMIVDSLATLTRLHDMTRSSDVAVDEDVRHHRPGQAQGVQLKRKAVPNLARRTHRSPRGTASRAPVP